MQQCNKKHHLKKKLNYVRPKYGNKKLIIDLIKNILED